MGYLVFGQREARLSSFGHIGKAIRAAAVGAALIAGSAAWSSAQAQGPIYVSQAGELINAFNQAATYTQQTGGTTTIILTQTIVLESQIVVNANVNFDGGSFVLDAVSNDRVLFIAGGTVNVSNLTIAGGLAKGGNGADGGGGGAGLGGGLFVASGKDIPGSNVTLATNVTLSNVAFNGNQVVGGNGAEYHTFGGGGGGMGGNGGVGYFFNAAENSGGGGGGFGVGANGGDAFYIDQTQFNLGQLGAFAWGQFFSGNPGGSGLGDNGDTGLGTVTTPGGFWGGGGGGSQAHGNYFLTPGNPSNNGGGGGVNGGNAGPTGAYATAGAGGFGGGGGGGSVGANGGFGGGGGGSNTGGRNLLYGGFGGGAGSSPQNAASAGGFGGGDAYNGSHSAGGGGAGLGGAIYVMQGASLTIGDGVTFSGNSVTGGSGGTANAGNGINAGAALFLGANVTFSITSGNTVTITQDLAGGAADSRSGDPGNNGLPYSQNPYAQGGISVIGGGSLVLGATNSYVGATQVLDGTLTLDGGALPYSKIYVGGSIGQDATLELINGGSANSIVVGTYGGSTSAVVIGSPTGTGGTITGDISFATGNTQLVFNQLDDGNPYSFGLLLAGPGAVYQNGAGTTILTNALNTYSGGTFVNDGILQVGALGALPGSGTVTINGGGLDINGLDLSIGALALFTGGTVVDSINSGALSAASITASGGVIAASLGGSGDILQQLSGTLELGGTNQYVGETRVTGGILNVTGSLHGSQVTVSAGGALQGTGEIGKTVTIESGGAISSGNNPDTLRLENLTLQTGAQSAFELDVHGTRNPITVNGIFDFGGIVNVVFIDPPDPSVVSAFPLFHYTDLNEFRDNGALIGEAPAGYNLRIDTTLNPGRVDLLVSYDGLQFWNGTPADNGGDGVWNLANANWTDPTGTVMGDPWDNSGQMTAVFRGTAGTVQVADDLTVAGLQFVTEGYELTAVGGSLILGSPQTEVRINSTATATLSVELSGIHGLVKTGGGTIVLAAANSYEGGTQINAGTLAISADENLGLASGSLTFLGGTLAVTDDLSSAREFIFTSRGSVDVANGKTLTLSGPLSGAGQMVAIGQGNLILTGDAEIEQGFAIAADSRLQFGNGGSAGTISGNLLNEGTVTFNYSDALTYSEAISGRGQLIKQGAGELTFAGASYFNGSLSVEAGRLTFAENAFIDAESVDIAAGATLQTAGAALGLRTELTNAGTFEFEGFEVVRSASGTGDFNLGGYLILTGGTSTISGIISGTGGLAVESVSSPVNAILSNQNTYTAPTIVLSGSLALTGSGSVATSSGFQLGDAGVLDISATTSGATIRNLLGSGAVNLGAKNLTVQSDLFSFFTGSISGTGGLIVESPGIFVLTRDQLYSGATRIQAGILASASLPYSTVSLAAGAAFAPAAGDTLAISVGGLQLNGGELWMEIQSAQADSIQIGAGGGQVNATTLIKFNAVNLINGQVYLLIDGLTPGWTLDQFQISGLPASGMLLMDPTGSGLYLSVYTGGYLSGSIIQNSYPVGTPTVANFLVNGAVTTDSQAQSNTINGLLFDPDSSLQIFNNLIVTSGSLNVPTGTATITGSNLVTPGNLSKLGSGVLNLLANALVNGTAQVEAGSLLINGTLVASNGVVISPNALLGGSGMIVGNVLNNGTLSPGNSPGTLTVAGNLTLGSGGTTLLEIESLSVFDRILVSGRATLGGTLSVVPYEGNELEYGQQFNFLSAGEVAGEFDDVTMPENFRGRIVVAGGAVTLIAAPSSYTQVAQNQNQLNVAAALDGFIAATSGDRLTVSTALDLLSEAQYPAAFDQISPAFYQSLTSTTIEQYNAQGQFLQQRFSSVALGRQAGFSTYGMNAPAFTEKTLDPKNPQSVIETPQSNWGLWTLGNGIFAKSSLASISGYRSESGGFLVGGDYQIGDTLVTGVFGGYQGTVSRYANGGRTTINAVRFGAYATYDSGNGFYANTVVGGGYSAYDAKRPIQFGNLNRAASSAPGGAEFTSQLAAGYDWKIGGFTFGPVGNVQYTYAGVGGFGENGAESLNLRVGQQNANSLRTTLGARAAYTWVVSDKIAIIPELRMSWQHEFLMNPTGMSAALDGGSGPGFGYTSTAPARDAVFAGAGVTLQVGDRWNANVYYNADFGRSDYTSQMISGGLGINF